MKFLFLSLLLLSTQLFGSKILTYNIYERSDRVDMMLTFDTPYEGKIKQHSNASKIVIKLGDASIEMPKIKSVNSAFVDTITITPMSQETQIIASIANKTKLYVSKTSDAYGLRLRFAKPVASTKKEPQVQENNFMSTLDTKDETEVSMSYIVVVILLFVAVIVLLILKKKISTGGDTRPNWLSLQKESKDNVRVRFQKSIDTKNKVVMLDYGEESYLVVMGTNNILLDKFEGKSTVKKESQFESMLSDKRESLDSFLQLDTKEDEASEAFDSYKAKASNLDFRL